MRVMSTHCSFSYASLQHSLDLLISLTLSKGMKIVWHVLFFVVVNLCWLHVISVSLSKGWPSVLIRWQKPNSVWLKSKCQSRVGNENVLAPVKKSKGNQIPSWLDWVMPSGLSLMVSPSLSSISLVLAAFSVRLWWIVLTLLSSWLPILAICWSMTNHVSLDNFFIWFVVMLLFPV